MNAHCRKLLAGFAVGLFWLTLWFLLAALVGNELLLPSPLQVLCRLFVLAQGAEFWRTVFRSILRVLAGISTATMLGVLLAALTEKSRAARLLLAPLMTVIKSTPVASFIILALIWLGRDILPMVITGLMVLPVVWANVSAGIAGQDPRLLEMAAVYQLNRMSVLRNITLPTVLPYFRSALSSALGLGWRAGIAAEVLTVPQLSIGRRIYESKLDLETTELFAWTLTVILLSLLIERVLLRLVRAGGQRGGHAHA